MNKIIEESFADHDGPDPLTDDDYEVIKGMVVGTGNIDVAELGHILKKNPTPLLVTLEKICPIRPESPGVYKIDLTNYKDEDDFIRFLREITRFRGRLAKPGPTRVHNYHDLISFFLYFGISFTIIFTILGAAFMEIAEIVADIFTIFAIAGVIGIFIFAGLASAFPKKIKSLLIVFPKIIHYLETHDDFASINELAATAKVSRQTVIEALTAFGEGTRQQRMLAAIDQHFDNPNKDEAKDLKAEFPFKELLYFLPPVDSVLRVSKTKDPRQFEQAEFDAIWGMLLCEKKIDFALTSEQLNVPIYHLLRAIYKIIATTPMKFTFTETSIDLLEEKDLSTFFTALKNEFSQWANL